MTYSGQVFFAKNSSDSPLKISMMKEIFSFLADVAANNNREWFAENRHRYADASGRFTAIAEDRQVHPLSFLSRHAFQSRQVAV